MGGVCFLKRVRTSCPSRRNASADSATPLLASRRAATLTVFPRDRKSTRLNSSHSQISYAVFCLKKKNTRHEHWPRGDYTRLEPPPPQRRVYHAQTVASALQPAYAPSHSSIPRPTAPLAALHAPT